MQTNFTAKQLEQPDIRQADSILRKCVHCGFCTATCPTFVITGDERDSPRGRIWMMRDMLEAGAGTEPDKDKQLGTHLDRCLTCLSCMTTCPSGVDYMHLVDIARDKLEQTQSRPLSERLVRFMLVNTVPYARRFHLSLRLAQLAKPFSFLLPSRLKAMVQLAPSKIKALDNIGASDAEYTAQNDKRAGRVLLLTGCAQRAIDPDINQATVSLLSRMGVEVVVRAQASCCGALSHHLTASEAAHQQMRQVVDAWWDEIAAGQIDAIIVNTSGCGTTLKDYGQLLADDPEYAEKGAKLSSLVRDVTEYLSEAAILPAVPATGYIVAYHAACSLQHGQKITQAPKQLLERAGFEVRSPKNPHLCCGSAGVYNVMQPELAGELQSRKLQTINAVGADIVAAGNIGCINQLSASDSPICHTIQLLDWVYGGQMPASLKTAARSFALKQAS